MSVNKVILVGRLGADPELRAAPSGLQVSNLSVATNHVAYDRDGNKNESTEWHRVVFFGRQAEVAGQYLKKGSQIYVEGRLRTNKYTDKDGIVRYTTDVIGEKFQMLGGRDEGGSTGRDDGGWGARDSGRPMIDDGGGFGSGGGFEDNSRPMPGSGGGQRAQAPAPQRSAPQKSVESFDDLDDDLPF